MPALDNEGHAQEYETATALYVFPENVRRDAIEDPGALKATAEQGRILVEAAIDKTVEYLQGMMAGKNRDILPQIFSKELYTEEQKQLAKLRA